MTLKACIDFVDGIEPNAYTNEQKTVWVNECEGMVYTDVFLLSPAEYRPLDYTADKDREMDVKPPHDKLYPLHLQAKIHFADGEYERYAASLTLFNEAWGEFVRWFARTYSPADGYPSENRMRW
ncbi:MAG: hypothetical protein IKD79_00825 [Oscillospiraceae bacterium]|nr:hypothetical protein [Oscillospiraceae bacterium]